MSPKMEEASEPAMNTSPSVDPDVIRRLLLGIPIGAAQTVIVARGPQVLAHRGALKPVEAADVAIYVNTNWRDVGQTLRIQFMRMPLLATVRLLMTYPLRGDHKLILIDNEEANIDQLRILSNQLLGVLAVAGFTR